MLLLLDQSTQRFFYVNKFLLNYMFRHLCRCVDWSNNNNNIIIIIIIIIINILLNIT
jgi:hypothetical protein